MKWTAEELYWWITLLIKKYKKVHQNPVLLQEAKTYLLMFKDEVGDHPNLMVQYDQLKRQLESAKG